MDGTDFVIDTMLWSFSRLQAFYNCRYEWKLNYIDCCQSEDGFFGEYGTFMHKILELYAKGELSLFDLNSYYEDNFDWAIPHDAPPNNYVDLRESYYNKGEDYLNNIDLDLSGYDVLGVEKEVKFTISNKPFVGYIDLLLKDKETDEIIIVDHKSASLKILKDGSVSKKDQDHFLDFKRQEYLYSIPVIEEYGRVDWLEWNLFKEQKWVKIPWKEEEYNEAIKWAQDTISLIENEKEWVCTPDYYYCNYLCGQRNNACEYKPR